MITIEKLETPIYTGDWHDPPLKWSVKGPGEEVQNFSTKKLAQTYKRIRKQSKDFAEACNKFLKV